MIKTIWTPTLVWLAAAAAALVLGRDGSVLARAEGEFDSEKARALRMTLMNQF